MSGHFVVVGAGPVGTETAQQLTAGGDRVTVVTRSGTGPALPSVTRVAADASDPERLTELTRGATALISCANPTDYTQWERLWPPLWDSILTAAERSGVPLVAASSLYLYGPVDGPMTESLPAAATDHKGRLRAGMWLEAMRRHDAGRIGYVEVRGSDYAGRGVGGNGHLSRQVPTARKGKTAWVIDSPDQPHTWTDVKDMARTLVAVATREDTWGRAWHAPSNPPRTQREALTDVLAAVGRPPVRMVGIPAVALRALGVAMPLLRELGQISYMFTRPYVMDSAAAQTELGLVPTPWAEVCRRTAEGNGNPRLTPTRRGRPARQRGSGSSPIGP